MDKVGRVELLGGGFIEVVWTNGDEMILNMNLCLRLAINRQLKGVVVAFSDMKFTLRCPPNERLDDFYLKFRTTLIGRVAPDLAQIENTPTTK